MNHSLRETTLHFLLHCVCTLVALFDVDKGLFVVIVFVVVDARDTNKQQNVCKEKTKERESLLVTVSVINSKGFCGGKRKMRGAAQTTHSLNTTLSSRNESIPQTQKEFSVGLTHSA
jgi:hypothetical protein